ncbi:MAG TPA: PadR family transcriptional regulator [Gammaproteobacteria bacterium]|jgi:PadR family transcriptional regulator PadR|nr:PadR family transcriptional regulator [Gammaproteobacteria bacterium]
MNTQFNKGILEMCVLALLAKRDCYGFELVDTISNHVDISEGTIYPLLRRLTQENYVETYLQESPSGPPRKYYHMTPHGKVFTENLIKEWNQFHKKINQLIKEEV